MAFAGQGGSWLDALAEITRDSGIEPEITALVNEAAELIAPVADELVIVRSGLADPIAGILWKRDPWTTETTPVSASPTPC